jgi:peroxiredoxin
MAQAPQEPLGSNKSFDDMRGNIFVALGPRQVAFYQSLLRWLDEMGLARRALKKGDRAPDFLLPDESGRLVSSRDMLASGPLVVSFFRGAWCPFGLAELRALDAAFPKCHRLHAELIAITPETGAHPRTMKQQNNLRLRILSDVDYGVCLAFGVLFMAPPFMKTYLEEAGIDVGARHGTKDWMQPLPATYVIGRSSVVKAAFVEPDYTRGTEPDRLVEVLQSL